MNDDQTESAERDANARLIAAAPDLLAACVAARGAIAFGNADWDAIYFKLSAAIAQTIAP